jgi:hypothetical protein
VLAEHINWSNIVSAPIWRTRFTQIADARKFPREILTTRDKPIPTKKKKRRSKKKRRLLPLLLVLVVLSVVAYYRLGGEETAVQTNAPTEVASSSTQTIPATVSPPIVATTGELFLRLTGPAELEVVTETESMTVSGQTRVDALVTINDTTVEPNIDGEFSLELALDEGPNIIEVVASVASGEQKDIVLVAVYTP